MKVFIILTLLMLTSCGGRVSDIISETSNIDDRLTCTHLKAEFEINLEKVKDISKERKEQVANNVGLLVASPFLLDFKDTEKKEILALQKRNLHLEHLIQEKSCPFSEKSQNSTLIQDR